jgi:hypothetical protein
MVAQPCPGHVENVLKAQALEVFPLQPGKMIPQVASLVNLLEVKWLGIQKCLKASHQNIDKLVLVLPAVVLLVDVGLLIVPPQEVELEGPQISGTLGHLVCPLLEWPQVLEAGRVYKPHVHTGMQAEAFQVDRP